MALTDVVSSVLSGGVTGLIGVIVQKVADYKSKQLDLEIGAQKISGEIEMKKVDLQIMAQEWASRTKIADIESASVEAQGANVAFSSALTSEPKLYSNPTNYSHAQEWLALFLDVLRGLVRPVLTLYLCVLTTMVYWQAKEMMGGFVDPAKSLDVLTLTVSTILYLMTTCVLFYFGTRNQQRPPKV